MITQRFALIIMGITTASIASVIGLVGGLNHLPPTYLVMFVASGVSGSAAGLMVLMKRIGGMCKLSIPKRGSKSTVSPDPKSAVKNIATPAKVVPPKVTQTSDAKPQPKPQTETPVVRTVAEPPMASPAPGGSLVTDIRTMKTQLQRIEWRLEQVSRLIGVDPMEVEPPMVEPSQTSQPNVQSTRVTQTHENIAPPAQTASPTDNPSAELIHSIAVSKSSSPFVKVPMPDEPKEGKEEVSTNSPHAVSASMTKKKPEEINIPAKAVEQPSKAADHDIIDYSDQLRELNQLKQELLRLRSGLLTKVERN